jgi:hypothetical protein
VVPYPAFGAVSWRGDVGNSTFEALQFNLRRAFHNGFLLSSRTRSMTEVSVAAIPIQCRIRSAALAISQQ